MAGGVGRLGGMKPLSKILIALPALVLLTAAPAGAAKVEVVAALNAVDTVGGSAFVVTGQGVETPTINNTAVIAANCLAAITNSHLDNSSLACWVQDVDAGIQYFLTVPTIIAATSDTVSVHGYRDLVSVFGGNDHELCAQVTVDGTASAPHCAPFIA